jgi:hypothetical protein
MKKTFSIILNLLLISKLICKEPLQQKQKEKKITYFDKSSIETINDDNFDRVMNAGFTNDYLILFTVKTCKVCDHVIEILEEAAELYLNTDSNVTFYKVDIIASGWTALRFDFEKLPNIIYVSKGKYAIYPLDNITKLEIKNFIEDKNKVMVNLPKKVGYSYLILKTFKLLSYMISQKFSFWDESYYWALIILFIAFIVLFEYIFIKYCCPRSNKNKKTSHEHHHHFNQNQINKKRKSKSD